MQLKFKIGFGVITVDAADQCELFEQASFWYELPERCGACQAPVIPHFRKTPTKNYKYYELHCTGPTPHVLQLGQHNPAGSLFVKQSNQWTVRQFAPEEDEPKPEPPPAAEKALSLVERIKKGQSALASVGVIVPKQLPDENEEQYLTRLQRIYSKRKENGKR